MSNKNTVKKKIGDDLFNFLSRNFSGDFIMENLPSVFGDIKECRKIRESDFQKVKTLLNELLEDNKETQASKIPTATSILDKLGYNLIETKTEKEYHKFKKYYASGEKLCKFGKYDASQRYSRLFWLVKKDIDQIKRNDFNNPKKNDTYSTSLLSVAVSKDGHNIAQICSRYNHEVSGCDNVFNSNLDNLAAGLTDAFNKEFNLSLKQGKKIELKGFYVHNGKYHYYSHEISGHKISDTCIDGVRYDSNTTLIFDNYILDLKQRKISTISDNDAFVDEVQKLLEKGFKIEIRKGELVEEEDDEGKIIIYKG